MIWGRRSRSEYMRLAGDGRSEMLRLYRGAERLLSRAGLNPRVPSQTLSEHTVQAEGWLGGASSDLAWLRRAAWSAAYNPSPYDPALLSEARLHLDALKAALKTKRRPRSSPQ